MSTGALVMSDDERTSEAWQDPEVLDDTIEKYTVGLEKGQVTRLRRYVYHSKDAKMATELRAAVENHLRVLEARSRTIIVEDADGNQRLIVKNAGDPYPGAKVPDRLDPGRKPPVP